MSRVIRTIGLYQPFGSLMLPEYGKVETRWIREGRKPPFPEGEYLIYTTKKPVDIPTMIEWCGVQEVSRINELLLNEPTIHYNGYAIAKAYLSAKWELKQEDQNTYVKFTGRKTEIIKGEPVVKIQWALKAENVQRIQPFKWKHGKQGVGIVPVEELENIKVLSLGEIIK